MQLNQLLQLGGVVPSTLFVRELPVTYRPLKPTGEWSDPDVPERESEAITQTVTVHVRKRSSADFLEMVNAPEADKPFIALLRCLVTPEGAPVFSDLDHAKRIEEWLLVPLLTTVNEVNGTDAKKYLPRTSSGAVSPSPSADGASRSGSKRYRNKSGRSGSSSSASTDP